MSLCLHVPLIAMDARLNLMCLIACAILQENSKFCSLECKLVSEAAAKLHVCNVHSDVPIPSLHDYKGSPGPGFASDSPSSSETAINTSFSIPDFTPDPFFSGFFSPLMSTSRSASRLTMTFHLTPLLPFFASCPFKKTIRCAMLL